MNKQNERKRLLKSILLRMLPVVLVAAVTVAVYMMLYGKLIDREMQTSWQRLDEATQSMVAKIEMRFVDHLNLMERVADAIVLHPDTGEPEGDTLAYLRTVRENTIFERIDLLLPGDKLMLESGEIRQLENQLSFLDVATRGPHISSRYTDHNTGRATIYCSIPILRGGIVRAILIGVIDCDALATLFPVTIYEGEASLFLVDRTDGKFLIDTWNDYLGTIDEVSSRRRLPGYEQVDIRSDLLSGVHGRVAFYSEVNGAASYMNYMPSAAFPWQVCVFVQEDSVLQGLHQLRDSLTLAGIAVMLLLLLYIGWNVLLSAAAAKNAEKARAAELEQEKNNAKARFLSSISHDIRTPLNGILGMLDIMQTAEGDPARQQDCLHKIRVSAGYLHTLLEDVLDINEIESGKITLSQDRLDLRQMVEEVEVLIAPRAKEAGVTYHVDVTALTHPLVLGSELYLHRILVNLISNAVKYNHRGGEVWLRIEEGEAQDGGALYCFTVQDSGIGMSEDFQKTMFEAFEQEHAGARTTNRGYGLGLSIVKSLVEKMHGSISVSSRLGEGSVFTVSLPLQHQTEVISEEQEATQLDLSGMQLLLVEDNELNMEIARAVLTAAGATITAATNGKEALQIFSRSQPGFFHAALMDVMMPEMDGCAATAAIRALPRADAQTIPIFAMTAATFAEDIARFHAAGMTGHLGKPLDVAAILKALAPYKRT